MVRDIGRMAESDALEDAYRFRTPSLRNVALTAPYGHNGAYPTLTGILRHHLDPLGSLDKWQRTEAKLPKVPWLEAIDFVVQSDRFEMARHRLALDLRPMEMSQDDVAAMVAFLENLTGETALDRPLGRPNAVPSGLPVD